MPAYLEQLFSLADRVAGVTRGPPLGELTLAGWDATMAVNLTAPFLLGQRFGPVMAERGWGASSTSPRSRRAGRSGTAPPAGRPRAA